MTVFWNRALELSQIERNLGKGNFGYVTGRRRVGKTALLTKACEKFGGIYHQAVEGTPSQQLIHLSEEIKTRLPIFGEVVPKNWREFFALLSKEALPRLVVFDEFPYWVQGDPALPSLLQKWIDHELPKKKTLVLVSGSSQAMLYSQFLNHASPLYGRATTHIHLEPMSFKWFCKVLKYSIEDTASFERYAIVGGVPHYWKLLPKGPLFKQIDHLYFEPSAVLSEEPKQILQDEGISGTLPKAILDLVGRGVSKPSELAARLTTVQGNLSRPLALLLDLGLIHKELPFGESPRTTKRVLYSIQDPSMAFHYRIFLPYREVWLRLTNKEKEERLNQHFSAQWENFCRHLYPGSRRYWEADVEIDIIHYIREEKRYLVGECKWKYLTAAEENHLLNDLRTRFMETRLGKKLKNVDFQIFSKKSLPRLF